MSPESSSKNKNLVKKLVRAIIAADKKNAHSKRVIEKVAGVSRENLSSEKAK